MKTTLEKSLHPYCLIALNGDEDNLKICGDNFRVEDNIIRFNDNPRDDIELKFISKVWRFDALTQTFIVVWKK